MSTDKLPVSASLPNLYVRGFGGALNFAAAFAWGFDAFSIINLVIALVFSWAVVYGIKARIAFNNAHKPLPAPEPGSIRELEAVVGEISKMSMIEHDMCGAWETRMTQRKMVDAGVLTEDEMSLCENRNCNDCARQRNVRKTAEMHRVRVDDQAKRMYDAGQRNRPAYRDNVIMGDVPAYTNIVCSKGGATIVVNGNVGRGASLVAEGGGAAIYIRGNIDTDTTIYASGGGAKVWYTGARHPSASVNASGGGAEVRKVSRSTLGHELSQELTSREIESVRKVQNEAHGYEIGRF